MSELEKAKSTLLAQHYLIERLTQELIKEIETREFISRRHDKFLDWLNEAAYEFSNCDSCDQWIDLQLDEDFLIYKLCEPHKIVHYYCSEICLNSSWCPDHKQCKDYCRRLYLDQQDLC